MWQKEVVDVGDGSVLGDSLSLPLASSAFYFESSTLFSVAIPIFCENKQA